MTTEERFIRIENTLQTVSENQARHESAIRDLIVVSRTLLESQKETTVQIKALAEKSAETDERLNALIDVVDRIIGKRDGN
jgi:hypothetical protein